MRLFVSPYILAAVFAWFVAQGLKYTIAMYAGRKLGSMRQLYLSGGMPSAHSASVAALLVVVGFKDGIDSAVFGLALLFAAVVMYDAIMVRRSSGEQGVALRWLFHHFKLKPENSFRTAKGHTPKEVFGGAILGLIIGLVVYFATL
ncbi:MAG: divergent PAP2 family protein [Candidatus Microsaccharimonas sossegonensis]|uniref:Divergent PAP2 family protein n=1 Tax=Candidatus Microsaccharimonas sossegonensis TaxID=2506948 RepID=A0A4V1J7F4_9BACT|nr:MAG: divergent PAP2 family protein [Candidatus Microsaccharimonas sossegonensis]